MARLRVCFKCAAQAVRHKGLRVLLSVVPFGEHLYDIAHEFYRLLREEGQDKKIRALFEEVAQAPVDEVRREAKAVAKQVAAKESPDVQDALAAYLLQIPAMVRQSLRRPADPSGRTIPADRVFQKPEDVMTFLPSRPVRFRPGDHPPGLPDWTLEELLGVGGFGEVWRGSNPFLGEAAFKFCLDKDAAETLRNDVTLPIRVQQEGKGTGIVEVLDTHLQGDPPYLKLEYIPGSDLAGVIQDGEALPRKNRNSQITQMIYRLAEIVGHFHRLQPAIVHRDLKPANILTMKNPDGSLELKVADFGIGGVVAQQLLDEDRRGEATQGTRLASCLRGSHTPLYASPQQKAGADPDPRDDVHALGVIWYQLLTNNLSAAPGSDYADDLRELGLHPDLIALLGRCVAARAERRPPDAQALADEIRAIKPLSRKSRLLHRLSQRQSVSPPRQSSRLRYLGKFALFFLGIGLLVSYLESLDGPDQARGHRRLSPQRNSIGMEFVKIPAGRFMMGSPPTDENRADDELHHPVQFTYTIYMSKYEVTQEQYQRVMGRNPSEFADIRGLDTSQLPVETVTWNDADGFCERLSQLSTERANRRVYRLPTEAEWEYACRVGAESYEPFTFGNTLTSHQANFDGKNPDGEDGPYMGRPLPVGSYNKNRFGLYDMHGNVAEWCQDFYAEDYYLPQLMIDPLGPLQGENNGEKRVVRGGSWRDSRRACRSASRGQEDAFSASASRGFRIVYRAD